MLVGLITRRSVVQIHAPLMPDQGIQTNIDEYLLMSQLGNFLQEIERWSPNELNTENLGQRNVGIIEDRNANTDLPADKIVVKNQPKEKEIDNNQNARAVANYIEAYERGHDFFPHIYGGKKDLSVIVTEHLSNQTDEKEIHPGWSEIGLREGDTNIRGELLTDWGSRGQYKVPVDMGQIVPGFDEEYLYVPNPTELDNTSTLPNCREFELEDEQYFVTTI